MTVAEFLVWNEQRPDGRYELLVGQPVKMQAERARHATVKMNAARVLQDAVRAAKVPCQVFPDGMTVVIDDETCYEPDCVVHCGPPVPPASLVVDTPVVVVEVLSPSTKPYDLGIKLADYLSVPSIAQVLLIDADKQRIIAHARVSATEWATHLLAASATLRLEPPGLEIRLVELFVEG